MLRKDTSLMDIYSEPFGNNNCPWYGEFSSQAHKTEELENGHSKISDVSSTLP